MKLYRYGYIGRMRIEEIEAESETKCFWIIKGRRESKTPGDYPTSTWYRTPEEAVRAYIDYQTKEQDAYLANGQRCQGKIDGASGFLSGLKKEDTECPGTS